MKSARAAFPCALLSSVLLVGTGCDEHLVPSGGAVIRPTANPPASQLAPPAGDDFAASPPLAHKAVCGDATPKGWARCFARVLIDANGDPIVAASPQGYSPSDVQSAYNVPAGGGANQIVALVDAYDDANAESDLAIYRSHYGLPPCTTANGCFKKVNQNGVEGNYPGADQLWNLETSLDLDAVSAVCPGCKILLVEADSSNMSDLGAAVNTAVRMGATAVSNSYGSAEDSSDPSSTSSYFHHPGVLITASTGDTGYGVQYPASSPGVLAVGGTTLVRSSSTRGWDESAWSSGGSGCSTYGVKPTWQTDTACSGKVVADVSAAGDPSFGGIAIYNTAGGAGGWMVIGGTSLAAPLIASIFAVTGRSSAPLSFAYTNHGWFNDVTQGSNGQCSGSYFCTAGPGFDGPTGVGTPNAAQWPVAGGGGSDGGVDGGVKDAGPMDSGTIVPDASVAAAPSVALISPSDGASLTANATIQLVARITAAAGISKVVLHWQMPSGAIDVDCASPPTNTRCTHAADGTYTFSFQGSTGARSWSIVATDSAGMSATSAVRTLSLSSPPASVVWFDGPAPSTAFSPGATVPIRVEANAQGVSQVWVTWSGPAGSTDLQLSSLGGTQWGVDTPTQPTAIAGDRTLTATAYDQNNSILGTATETIQIQ